MTGIQSYSTTAANNIASNTGITWDEGMSPATVNNSARQNMADTRAAFNDLIWFKYGKGDLDYSPVYVASTQFKIAGADVTSIYHAGRRVKAVGATTGTIYGSISSSAYSTDTTVTVTWDSGSLANETLTIYLCQVPVTGKPVSLKSVNGDTDLAIPGATLFTDSGSGASLALTGFGATGTLGWRNFTTTDGSGLSMVCVSNGVVLNNGATSWSAISDERKKVIAAPITDALAKVLTLRTVTGRYKIDPEDVSRPFLIAQDVQKVLPEAVHETEDGTLVLSYTDTIPLLVAAIKELAEKL